MEDILFAAGEALAFLWGGVPVTVDTILKTNYTSLSMSSNFLMGNVSSSLPSSINMDSEKSNDVRDIVRDAITRKLFDVLLYSSRKDERCAGTVWLLSLTIYCGHHPTIQKLLPNIQVYCLKPNIWNLNFNMLHSHFPHYVPPYLCLGFFFFLFIYLNNILKKMEIGLRLLVCALSVVSQTCIAKNCLRHYLYWIQEAFSHLLAEQNELIQELASQGLSIVYEIGDASMKKNLVDALVGTLTGSGKRKRAVKVGIISCLYFFFFFFVYFPQCNWGECIVDLRPSYTCLVHRIGL